LIAVEHLAGHERPLPSSYLIFRNWVFFLANVRIRIMTFTKQEIHIYVIEVIICEANNRNKTVKYLLFSHVRFTLVSMPVKGVPFTTMYMHYFGALAITNEVTVDIL
jgi:hypothetical protein